MPVTNYDRNRHARRLFDGIVPQYDLLADLFSFRCYGAWRRYLVSRLTTGGQDTVLDLCTGTAGVALQVARTRQSRVVAVDLSTVMLRRAQQKVANAGLKGRVFLVTGRAETLAFADACFDAVCVTFLFRYVDDPEATLREIIRVLKPGGQLVSLEFGVPRHRIVRALWYAYTRAILPLAAGLVSRGWREISSFLGPSISRLDRTYPEGDLRRMWLRSGVSDVRVNHLSLGGAVVMWGTKAG